MLFSELAEKRFSVRKFTSQPLPGDVIEKILRAGYVAPTGCNKQPQRILVINTPESIEKLRKCTACHFYAPAAMLICYNRDECWHRPYDGAPSGPMDASIVTTHMMLEAAELGVGTTWVMFFDPAAVRREFCVPDNIEPVAFLMMGYPAPDAQPFPGHTEFRPEEELVSYGNF